MSASSADEFNAFLEGLLADDENYDTAADRALAQDGLELAEELRAWARRVEASKARLERYMARYLTDDQLARLELRATVVPLDPPEAEVAETAAG